MRHEWWWVIAAVLAVAEMFTGGLVLLMFALGAAVAGLMSISGLGIDLQLLGFAIGVAVGFALLRARRRRLGVRDVERDAAVHPDIGQSIDVPSWNPSGVTRVRYRGADWDIEEDPSSSPGTRSPGAQGGRYRIVAVHGNRLRVRLEQDATASPAS